MLHVDIAKQIGALRLEVRFDLPTPGVAALFGPSGCGKSSTINIIAGLLEADRGRVVLEETVLFDAQRRIDLAAEQRRIGYVFQDARLFPHLSVAGNLQYALRRAVGRRYVSLDTVANLLDLGALMHRRTHQLSGGERQRVAIGRALLSQPRLLLLDEPLASLDRNRREELLPYLETLRDQLDIPMVYVSHQFDEVLRLATHIVLMQSGTVVAQGGIGAMSLDPNLRSIIGPDAVGAIIDGVVLGRDLGSGLARVRVGGGVLRLQTAEMARGTTLRIQLLARDIIVSTQMPRYLSVRNNLQGEVTAIDDDDGNSDLISIDIGGAQIIARITKSATRELALKPGSPVWALIKSVSLRGHSFPAYHDR
ncbi:MAG: molybdenum ABC transporter ATP-binding protein [Steroidobacteraceae bacterium]